MRGVNLVVLCGTLGKDVELRKTTGGKDVANFSIATNEVWTDNDGKKNEHTEWHTIVVWGKPALNAEKYLRKGSRVHVTGKIRTRSWDHNGETRYAKEIIADEIQYLDPATNKN